MTGPLLPPARLTGQPPPPRTPCPVPREVRPCEVRPATAADVRRGQKLAAALFGMAAASGVDLEPPPRRGR